MAKKRHRRSRKKQGKVVIKERAKLVHKGDSIGRDSLPKAPAKVYPENSVNFKVKLRKK